MIITTPRLRSTPRFMAMVIGIAALALSGFAYADPPTRVARLGYLSGPLSFSPAGEDEWVEAAINRPLVTGDRLWSDAGGRAELQVGSAAIRLAEYTSLTILNLDDRLLQLQLVQGTLALHVRRLDPDQVVEIDTPNLAYVIRQPGLYRVSVDLEGSATDVRTSSGQAEVFGGNTSYSVAAGRAYRFRGADLRDYESLGRANADAFDRWAQDRDRGYDQSVSARYVSRDVIGFEDLDAYGSWRSEPEYGNVWRPTRVAAGWAPYQDGHWAWVEPWGWTWVDDAPWGFAVSHYGRWAHIGGSWGWIPGPTTAHAVYAPALVAFIGGPNFQIAISSGRVGAVGWFPLGPRDVYRPAYPVSRSYFSNVNASNTVINNTTITNVYNTRNVTNVTNVTYVNQQVPGAVVTVPTTAFVQAQPVAKVAVRMKPEEVARAPVATVAAIAPLLVSVSGAAPQSRKPPPQALGRAVIAKTEPAAAPVAFAARKDALAAHPGQPVEPSALAALKPVAPVAAAKVAVVSTAGPAMPAVAPPAPPDRAKTDTRGQDSKKEPGAMPLPTAAPKAETPPVPPAVPPASDTRPVPVRPQPPQSGPQANREAPPTAPKADASMRRAETAPGSAAGPSPSLPGQPAAPRLPEPPTAVPAAPNATQAPKAAPQPTPAAGPATSDARSTPVRPQPPQGGPQANREGPPAARKADTSMQRAEPAPGSAAAPPQSAPGERATPRQPANSRTAPAEPMATPAPKAAPQPAPPAGPPAGDLRSTSVRPQLPQASPQANRQGPPSTPKIDASMQRGEPAPESGAGPSGSPQGQPPAPRPTTTTRAPPAAPDATPAPGAGRGQPQRGKQPPTPEVEPQARPADGGPPHARPQSQARNGPSPGERASSSPTMVVAEPREDGSSAAQGPPARGGGQQR